MKRTLSAILCFSLLMLVSAFAIAEETALTWLESSEEEIMERLGLRFSRTEEMDILSFQIHENACQMQFMLDFVPYTARIQPSEEFQDISSYAGGTAQTPWTLQVDCMIGRCPGRAMMAQREDMIHALCLWYDAAPGLMYSIEACTPDFRGLDIQRAAESVFAPVQGDADGLHGEALKNALIACTGYEGTAGSSLKNAIAACNLASFAADHQLADLDELFLSEAVADALSALTEEQAAEISIHLESIHSVLTNAFTDYSSIRDLFDTAGIAGEMDLLIAAERTFEHYSALYEQLLAAGLQTEA